MTLFLSAAVLVALFAIATTRPINMGLLGFAGAFLVGGVASGMSVDEIEALFPGDLFIIVVGLTLLFGIAKANGTVDMIMSFALRLVRGRPWAVVWLMFVLAAALMALGSPMAVAMLAPIAMPLAKRYEIDPLLMGMMLSHGALSTAFSPVTVYSAGVGTVANDLGIETSPAFLFLVPFVLNLAMAAGLFVLRGRNLLGRAATGDDVRLNSLGGGATGSHDASAGGSRASAEHDSASALATAPMTVPAGRAVPKGKQWEPVVTLLAIVALMAGALAGLDVGVSAMCLSALLLLMSPRRAEAAMGSVAWAATLLVCGVVTYMGVLSANGSIDAAGERATAIPWPLVTALVLFLVVGLISAIGSSIGIILIALPLAAPLIAQNELGAIGFVAALGFCATVVDVSPFSTNGVIVLASAEVDDKRRFQRRMLAYSGYVVLAAPVLALVTVVIPTS